ncbi:MAG: hypothetical protein JWQ87_3090 [Candidatus Sulfotelmatobacter sp.]|nr:hypothetical protein [Candidatus Sulfotelmatobacter sp.]
MANLPELPDDAKNRIQNARRLTQTIIPHARIHLGRAAEAQNRLSNIDSDVSNQVEISGLQEEKDSSFGCAVMCIRSATQQYFDICAWQYWEFLDSKAPPFIRLLPILSLEAENDIAFPELIGTIRETCNEKTIEWTRRVNQGSKKAEAGMQYAQEMHEVLADFRFQITRSPDRRMELLERLACDLAGVHLREVLPQVTSQSKYVQFTEKVGWAKVFIAEPLTHFLQGEDYSTARRFIDAECERLMGVAAKQARTPEIDNRDRHYPQSGESKSKPDACAPVRTAVCPTIVPGARSQAPKIFLSELEAKTWQELCPFANESASVLSNVTFRDQGWNTRVPVRSLSDYSPAPAFTGSLDDLLPRNMKQFPELPDLEGALDDLFAGRTPEIGCSLDEDWQFGRIQIPPMARSGLINLVSEGGFPGVAFSFVRMLEQSFNNISPEHSAMAVSDFWQSWEVCKHLADFCYELGRSITATLVVGDRSRSEEEARKAYIFIRTQLAAFAQSAAHNVCSNQDFSMGQTPSSNDGMYISPIRALLRETVLEQARREAKRSLDAYEARLVPNPDTHPANPLTTPLSAGPAVERETSQHDFEPVSRSEFVEPEADQSRKGDRALLAGKRAVRFATAEKYLGVTDRHRQRLIKMGCLVVEGQGQNKKITTESLRSYLPPENPT